MKERAEATGDLRDPLTGVLSRAGLTDHLAEEVARAQEGNLPFSVVLIDLDHFKSVNDAFGHGRGDQVLIEFVERLRGLARSSDLVFRYGGDEFLILLRGATEEQALGLGQRLISRVQGASFRGDPPLSLSLSVGVAALGGGAMTADDILARADRRLMEAKRRGRGRAVADDLEREAGSTAEAGRLVEREVELESIHRFLLDLLEARRGIMLIGGERGAGRSRLLMEAGRVSALRGYEVLEARPGLGLRSRWFGALSETPEIEDYLPKPWTDGARVAREMQRRLLERGRVGLCLLVDELDLLDSASRDLVADLLASPGVLPFALMATVEGEPRPLIGMQPPLVVGMQAKPFSRHGVLVWLRTLLQREAPDELVAALLESTGGRPGVIRRAVHVLADRGLLGPTTVGPLPEAMLETVRSVAEAESETAGPYHNLPIESDFLGREVELRALKTRLDAARLVVIVGPGGIGKTRLAVQAAAECLERFRDGVYLIPAGESHSPDDLVLALAQPMRLLFAGAESPRTQVLEHLRHRRVLFVLDNLVFSAEGGQLLREILTRCPEVALLVTSRDRLSLPGEVDLELQGMELPPDHSNVGVESFPAVQLFLQCARRARPGFDVTAIEREAVVGICRLVEGMPLGIELAASWVRVLDCQEILAEIEMNLGFLAEAGPGRPRSLRAVFDHFWRALSGEEQRVLRQLSVFRGGFRGASAGGVAGASLFFLSALVDKAFLRRDVRGRFTMHEVLRQYAQERLSEAPAELALRRERHAAYYLELVEQHDVDLVGGRQLEALSELEEDWENVRAAWRWASASGRFDLIDRSLDGIFRLHDMRNTFEEGCEVLASAANLEAELARPADAQAAARVRARLLVRLGKLRHRLSQHNAARQHLTEALEVLRETGPVEDVIFGECYLGDIAKVEGRYPEARLHLDAALALALEAGDEAGQVMTLNLLGIVSFSTGELDEARAVIDRSLALARRLEDRWGTAICLINLGIVADMRQDRGEARACYEESLALCRLIGDRRGMANCLNNLGFIAEALGEFGEARRLYEEGMDIYEQIGYRWGAANTRVNIANATAAMGDYGEAERHLAIALRAALDLKAIPLVVEALVAVAQLWAAMDRLGMAQAVLGVALQRTEADVETRIRAERLAAELAERVPAQLADGIWGELPLEEAVEAVVEALRPAVFLPMIVRALPP